MKALRNAPVLSAISLQRGAFRRNSMHPTEEDFTERILTMWNWWKPSEKERPWRPDHPVSDEEFVAACPVGSDPSIALKVREIISQTLSIPCHELHPAMRFIEDIDAI